MNRWIRALGTLSRSLLETHGYLPAPRRPQADTTGEPKKKTAPLRSRMDRLRAHARAARRKRAGTERYYVSGAR